MLELYRRHTKKCPQRLKGRGYTKCGCPIWVDGHLHGVRFRRAVRLRSWSRAVKRVELWERSDEDPKRPVALVPEAITSYLADCRTRRLAVSTVRSYAKTLEYFERFCEAVKARHIAEVDLAVLTDFRAGRKVAASTSRKELEALRTFCAFAKKRSWIEENYAKELDPPKEGHVPTLPFTRHEVERIIAACDCLPDDNPFARDRTRRRARALCLVMLYSGLRISDTIKIPRAAVDLETGKMLLRVMKTGVPLYVRLGQPAIEALVALPMDSEYFFWNGESKLATAVGNARRTISRVLAIAGVEGHPHRFRDTFSVRLLELGEDLRTVQLLLGHQSVKTTEKHYAPFVRSFRKILDAATAKLDFSTSHGTKSGTRTTNDAKLLKLKEGIGGS